MKTSYTKQARDHFRAMNFIGIGFTLDLADEEVEKKKKDKIKKENPEALLKHGKTGFSRKRSSSPNEISEKIERSKSRESSNGRISP